MIPDAPLPDDKDDLDDEDDLEESAWEELAVEAEVQTHRVNGTRLAGKLSKIQYCQVSPTSEGGRAVFRINSGGGADGWNFQADHQGRQEARLGSRGLDALIKYRCR